MTTDRWRRISRLFHAATDLSSDERRAFLAAACPDDDALRFEVESLLDQRTSAEPLLAGVSASSVDDALATDDALLPGESPRGLRPGQLLSNRFRIVAFLGRGGMGDVYRADDLQLGQPIALKFLSAVHRAWHTAYRERFLREVRLARQVAHPNVCRVFDVGEENGLLYLSMEYVDGEDLSSLLRRIGRLPADKGLEIAHQICAGLAAAHAKGILHLDLKPANVMIDGRGVARISDFGLAAAANDTMTSPVAGTPAYMAPEQLAGQRPTMATDIFTLGLVLYEIFSGHQPLAALSLTERRSLSPHFEPPPPSTYARDLDVSVDAAVLSCLMTDPARRPASALAVAAALPGGDVLNASVAAGHIPSPDLVAAYGVRRRASPLMVWSLLGGAIAGTLLAAAHSDSMMLYRQVPLEKPPEVLVDRANSFLDSLGHVGAPVDLAYWFTSQFSYAEQRLNRVLNEPTPGSAVPAILFTLRRSPQTLTPANLFAVVSYRDPPADVPGMADVVLDGRGALIRFVVVPTAKVARADAATPDWPGVFAAAGLDIERFVEIAAEGIPPVPADARWAWSGNHPSWPGTPVHVSAATFAGQPVYFDIQRAPFDPSDPAPPPSARATLAFRAVLVLLYITWAGAAVLARRNLRRGQGDRKGAWRLALFYVTSGITLSLLRADHVSDFRDEYFILVRIAAWILFWGGTLYLLYVGFEPLARRRWPHVLVSWTNVLRGRFSDPIVGRDVLVGIVAGVAATLWLEAQYAVARTLFGTPLTAFNPSLEGFRDLRHLAALALFIPADALISALVGMFLLVLLRELLRRQWIANVAWVLMTAPITIAAGDRIPFELAFSTAASVLGIFVLLRVGVLAYAVTLLTYRALLHFPITLDFSAWYFQRSVLVMLAIGALAAYACRTALRQQLSAVRG